MHHSVPMTDVNAQVFVRKIESQMGDAVIVNHGKSEAVAKKVIKKLAKEASEPYAKRSKSIICSFYVKGNCKRGVECPFTHEMPAPKRVNTSLVKSDSNLISIRN